MDELPLISNLGRTIRNLYNVEADNREDLCNEVFGVRRQEYPLTIH